MKQLQFNPNSYFKRKAFKYKQLLHELSHHRYFQSLRQFDWKKYRIGQIIIASVLINLLELSAPIYINIVYSVILPRQAIESLILLTILVVVLMMISVWLKIMRLDLVGEDSARVTHEKRVNAISHFVSIPIRSFLKSSPSEHISRLNSINLLKDNSALQSLTTAIDLIFSLIFIVILFMVGGIIALPVLVGISVFFFKSLSFAKDFEDVSKEQDQLEIKRLNTQIDTVDSVDLIKANGLNTQYLTSLEPLQERLSWRRMKNNQYLLKHQAFGNLVSQATLAAVATLGAILVINDRLLVGALAAAILLIGKIFNPWQRLSTLWSSYRSLVHSQDEYQALMSTPIIEVNNTKSVNTISPTNTDIFTITTSELGTLKIHRNESHWINSNSNGMEITRMFENIVLAENDQTILLNDIPLSEYSGLEIIDKIAYVNPSFRSFDGSLIQNLSCFEPSKYKRSALFWSYLLGIDEKIKTLPLGYDTTIGSQMGSGLSSDDEKLLHIISGLSKNPLILLIDLNGCTFGKPFIEGIQTIISCCNGRTTLVIAGTSPVLGKICNQTIQTLSMTKVGGVQ
ncbi:ABC transporter transmembrane domain-containing protein [Synechococcus sp. CC9311]|uniref:ABC transporter transmembrane domain-containing protein n=1 Tax=Synechococcus sp. (strain CC9311) TaxID=64471 RepID=UPI0000DDADAE|nr:ABC transporter transmembrane domain-containing protein [Synechococcus sp. CC9311]ABI47362.1 ABC transporter RzcB, putative [Synechococcus sp. CC9311]